MELFVYLVIIFLPSYLIRFTFFGVPTNVLEVLISLLLIAWVIGYWKKIEIREILKKYKSYLVPVGLILGGLIISTLVNGNIQLGLGIIKGWFIFPLILAFLANELVPSKRKERIFLAFYFSAVVVAIISIFNFFLGHVTYDGRLEAPFNSPNYLGMYLAYGILIGIIILSLRGSLRPKQSQNYSDMNNEIATAALEASSFFTMTVIISNFMLLISLYFTYSYASWMALIASLLLILIYTKKINIKILIAVILLLLVAFYFQLGSLKFTSLVHGEERSSLSSRIMIWRSAARILSDNALLGVGPGDFQEKYLAYQKYYPPYLEWAVPHPHNIFLAFWLSGGILSLAGFIWIIYRWFKSINKRDLIALFSLAIVSYTLLHGLVDTTYFKNDLAIVFWLGILSQETRNKLQRISNYQFPITKEI